MKIRILIITGLLIVCASTSSIQAQVGIDKTSGFSNKSILEFGTEPRGIRLMPIDGLPTTNLVPGTIVFDADSDSFRYYGGNPAAWSTIVSGGSANVGLPLHTDSPNQSAIIGAASSAADGVLILGADTGETRAMVLPKVAVASIEIVNPPAGLIVYETFTKTLVVYNGSSWTKF